ncbi:MAG: response regulator transcription factor [Planctomycetes bacterium]|nr:response regulator transcription factor [Planctomycetota bacterium]
MTVVLIEDDNGLAAAASEALVASRLRVEWRKDFETAYDLAVDPMTDLIVLARSLPDGDGVDFLRQLRSAGITTAVLMISARTAIPDRVAALEAGADDYLVKPFAFEELLARVKALTRRRYAVKSPTVRIGDLEIDRASQRVKRGERAIEVTAKQYAFLELLALRAGQVVSRAEIWSHLYEFEAEPNSNLLEVYVGQLRRKLEAAGESRLIHTRRGAGYVLEEIA